ncbi:Mismatch repair endonuclease pms2 [Linnemannia exigua]|uniref:DNA mismatch repair protein PMS1 n=1 Tax=Linnemannia exigua TaxID=604196 RepID=A0AAD4D9J1_9FUNG|nr:Mismatch repair endonuclease pms2 [Linnemannia exigua]
MAAGNAIRPIDRESVHRICSGQVVLDMATAVKELLENSLDAGATSIVVKFKQSGLDYITVTDNGCGITDVNLDTLALKHYTSKLSSFNDLAKVRSFGFRGEALSSLCALAHVTVTTSTGTSPTGLLVEYNSDGLIQSKTPAPMTKGTIVKISNLFEGMPVRRSEFVKNIKREYNKCIGLVQAYALIATNVRISCVSQVDKKPAMTYIATSGNASVRQNIINVFGPKAMIDLVDFELRLVEAKPRSSSNKERDNNGGEQERSDSEDQDDNSEDQDIILTGHISSPSFGKGRSSTDRQYLFINGRPCVLPKIARVINEVYHSFNTNQSPFLIANLILPTAAYDVNVSPDKRTIFLHNERRLVEELRNKLTELFEPSRSTFAVSEARQLIKKPDLATRLRSTSAFSLQDDGETIDEDEGMEERREDGEEEYLGVVRDLSKTHSTYRPTTAPVESITLSSFSKTSPVSRSSPDSATTMATRLQQTTLTDRMRFNESAENRKRKASEDASESEGDDQSLFDNRTTRKVDQVLTDRKDTDGKGVIGNLDEELSLRRHPSLGTPEEPPGGSLEVLETYDPLDDILEKEKDDISDSEDEQVQLTCRPQSNKLQRVVVLDSEVREDGDREWIEVGFDMDDHRRRRALRMKILRETRRLEQEGATLRKEKAKSRLLESMSAVAETMIAPASEDLTECNVEGDKDLEETQQALRRSRRLRSQKLSDASFANMDDAKAQQSLSRVISKGDFRRMKILGQFNKAFIVARLDNYANGEQDDANRQGNNASKHHCQYRTLVSSDIFVIDQHASDEKYNFETLQAKTVFSTQRLFQPKKLHLTAQEEITVVDHIKMLNMNGFYLDYNPEAQVSHRLQLVTLPVSEKVVFDLQDFEELVFLLSQQTASSYGSLEDGDGKPGHQHRHKLHSPEDKMVRCSKVRALFASRACRRSVMIGHVLNHAQMKRIVRHMGEIDQPWNCPHGRPTMRHLLDLAELDMQERRARRRQHFDGSRVDDDDDDGQDESRIANIDRAGSFDPIAVKRPTRHQGSLFKQFLAAKCIHSKSTCATTPRSEYWKSNAKFFCRFCKIYITDNKSTRNIHDQGSKHKENVERFLRDQNQRGRDREAESARMDKQMDAIEKAAMKQYQLDVEAGLVQPSVAQKGAADTTTAKIPAKDVEATPTETGLLKVSVSPASVSSKEKEDLEEGKEDTGSSSSELIATTPPVKAKDETIGQPGEWQTVEAPVPNTLQQQGRKDMAGGVTVEDDDEDVAGNPEDLRRFKIVEKTYPVDDDDVAGEDGASGGSAVFKKRKGGVGKPRNIRRKL